MPDFSWFLNAPVTNRVCPQSPCNPGDPEGGIDKNIPPGTPITSLGTGTIVGIGLCKFANGNPCGGYVITTRLNNVPGLAGPADVYYQHLQSLAPGLAINQQVRQGQTLGYSGGNTEFGINPNWYGPWGPKPHPGPWQQSPEPYLRALAGDVSAATTVTEQPGSGTIAGAINSLVPSLQTSIASWGLKIGLFIIAMLLVIFGGFLLFSHQLESGAKTVGKAAVLA